MNNKKISSDSDIFSAIGKDGMDAVKMNNPAPLLNRLSADDKQKLASILNDKAALNKILNSPEAKAIGKILGEKKNG